MYTEEFGCCLERTLRTVDTIQSISHLYNTTKQCNTYLVTPLNDSLFITAVVHFYLREMENTTLVCKQEICEEKTSKYYIAYVSFWIIALIVGVIGNILVCVAFYQSAILRKAITNFFVTSLAISDLLVVVFIIPLKIHYALHNQEFCAPPIFCRLFYTTDTTFFAASITNIFIISVDRYVAVVRPYNYRDILTPKRGKTLIVCIWIYSAIWGLMVHFNPNTNNFDAIFLQNYTCSTNNQLYYRIQYAMVFYIPSIIMFIIYIKILRISRSHARHIDARRNNLVTLKIQKKDVCTLFHQPSYFANHKHELRATKVVVVVYGTFLLCWFPIIFTSTFHYLLSPSLHSKLLYSIIAEILPFTNSLFNPFIYGILHRDFKRSLKRIFAKIILEYQMIGTVRRSSQSTKSYEISSNESTPNTNDVMEDCKLKQNKDEALLPMASKKSNAI